MKRFSAIAYYLIIVFLFVIFGMVTQVNNAGDVQAGIAAHDICQDADVKDQFPTNSGNSGSYTADSDKQVSAVCIKAGSDQQDEGHVKYTSDGTYDSCYTVSGIGSQTVTITRIGDGPDCKEISHFDVYKVLKASPTPTNGATPTPTQSLTLTPTQSPSLSPTPTTPVCEQESWSCQECQTYLDDNLCSRQFYKYCNANYGCEWVGEREEWVCEDKCPTPTPTPTVSTTPNPTSTPTPSENGGSSENKHFSLVSEGPTCEETNFRVLATVRENDVPKRDVEVRFEYNGEEQRARTNYDGVAEVRYDYEGEGHVEARTDGFEKISVHIKPLECDEVQGQVLGYADTGASGGALALTVEAMGLLSIMAGGFGYLKIK